MLSDRGCVKIDGIIGANLINHCNWQINPKKQVISFSRKPFNILSNKSSRLNLEYAPNGLPHIKLNYGETEFYSLIDYGFAGYLDINKSVLSKSKKLKSLNPKTRNEAVLLQFCQK